MRIDMRAAGYAADGRLVLEERPMPAPGEDEVLVAIDYCGICGTDVHAIREGWARAGAVLGHSARGGSPPSGPAWAAGRKVMRSPSSRVSRAARASSVAGDVRRSAELTSPR